MKRVFAGIGIIIILHPHAKSSICTSTLKSVQVSTFSILMNSMRCGQYNFGKFSGNVKTFIPFQNNFKVT